jgi:hypothetical protein
MHQDIHKFRQQVAEKDQVWKDKAGEKMSQMIILRLFVMRTRAKLTD